MELVQGDSRYWSVRASTGDTPVHHCHCINISVSSRFVDIAMPERVFSGSLNVVMLYSTQFLPQLETKIVCVSKATLTRIFTLQTFFFFFPLILRHFFH